MLGDQWQFKPPLGTSIDWSVGLSSGLVVALPFNEASGPPNNQGLVGPAQWPIHGAGPTWGSNASGPGMVFASASSQYLSGPNIAAQMSGTTWSVGFAMSNTGVAGFAVALGVDNAERYNFFQWPASNSIGVLFHSGSDFTVTYSATNQLALHHYLWTYDGATLNCYIDGTQQAGQAVSSSITWTDVPYIGAEYTGDTFYIDGTMSYMNIWNRTLSPSEAVQFHGNPWQIYSPLPVQWFYKATAPTTHQSSYYGGSALRPKARTWTLAQMAAYD